MSKLPYEAATCQIEQVFDVVFCSNDNAYIDPWNLIPKFGA